MFSEATGNIMTDKIIWLVVLVGVSCMFFGVTTLSFGKFAIGVFALGAGILLRNLHVTSGAPQLRKSRR